MSAVVWPHTFVEFRTKVKYSSILSVTIWLVWICLSMLYFFFRDTVKCSMEHIVINKSIMQYICGPCMLILLLMTIIFHIKVYFVTRHLKIQPQMPMESVQHSCIKMRMQGVTVGFILTMICLITWLPLGITIVFNLQPDNMQFGPGHFALALLQVSRQFINICVYISRSQQFRDTLKKMLHIHVDEEVMDSEL